MDSNLKPCPFCGEEAVSRQTSLGHSGDGRFTATIFVGCDRCHVGFHYESVFRLNGASVEFILNGYEMASEKWNRRLG